MKIADMTLEELTQSLKGTFVQCNDCDKRHEQIATEMKEMKAIATESRDKINDVGKGIRLIKALVTAVPPILAFLSWLSQHCSP